MLEIACCQEKDKPQTAITHLDWWSHTKEERTHENLPEIESFIKCICWTKVESDASQSLETGSTFRVLTQSRQQFQ